MFESLLSKLQRALESRDPEALVRAILETAGQLFGSDISSFGRFDRERGQIVFSHFREDLHTHEDRVDANHGIAGFVIQRAEAVVSNDLQNDPRHRAHREAARSRSMLCVPVVQGDEVLGVLQVQTSRSRPGYSQGDLESFRSLARLLAHLWSSTPTVAPSARGESPYLAGDEGSWLEAIRVCDAAAGTESPVCIQGERGTGKESLARRVHVGSPRSEGPFIRVACGRGDLDELAERLFGTAGPGGRVGALEEARGGSLYLDEVDALPMPLQAPLAQVLSERHLVRIGGAQSVPLDFRCIVSSTEPLSASVASGRFREELRTRVQVVTTLVPALRDRASDIAAIARAIVEELSRELGREAPRLESAALRSLQQYGWPGNVRELRSVLATVLARGVSTRLRAIDLPAEIRSGPVRGLGDAPADLKLAQAVEEFRRAWILRALELADGHQTRAAELLGLKQPNLSRLMRLLGIRGRQ
ncbi:MAG: sigma 54-interacting transcriptional regulator [Planctomycetota bacterium]